MRLVVAPTSDGWVIDGWQAGRDDVIVTFMQEYLGSLSAANAFDLGRFTLLDALHLDLAADRDTEITISRALCDLCARAPPSTCGTTTPTGVGDACDTAALRFTVARWSVTVNDHGGGA